MARSGVNKVTLIGNVGQDPEIRYLPSQVAVATFSVATSETWKDKESGDLKEQTEWHRLVCYRKLAEIVEKYLRKGSKVFIEGRLRYRKWKDNQGTDRVTTEIQVDDLLMLDSRRSAISSEVSEENADERKSQKSSSVQNSPFGSLEAMEFDDEIPF